MTTDPGRDRGAFASEPGSREPRPAVVAASGFDPSRAWRTDQPDFEWLPIYQFVLLEGYQEHSGRTWRRQWAGTATIDRGPGNRFGYRGSDIDRIQRDGDMVVVERVAGWVPATWPRYDWFLPASAMSARSDETACGLSPQDASAVAKPDAQGSPS